MYRSSPRLAVLICVCLPLSWGFVTTVLKSDGHQLHFVKDSQMSGRVEKVLLLDESDFALLKDALDDTLFLTRDIKLKNGTLRKDDVVSFRKGDMVMARADSLKRSHKFPLRVKIETASHDCDDYHKLATRFNTASSRLTARSTQLGTSLEGGITFYIKPQFCTDIQRSIREAGVDCDDILAAVHRAFDVWSDRHPGIYFRNVTEEDQVSAAVTVRAEAMSQSRSGAHPIAYVRPLEHSKKVSIRGTNGKDMPPSYVTRWELVVNTRHCFYFNPRQLCLDTSPRAQYLASVIAFCAVMGGSAAFFVALYMARSDFFPDTEWWEGKTETHAVEASRFERELADLSPRLQHPPAPDEDQDDDLPHAVTIHTERPVTGHSAKRPDIPHTRVVEVGNFQILMHKAKRARRVIFLLVTAVVAWAGWQFVRKCPNIKGLSPCFHFEATVSHEMGHVLGIGHSDDLLALDTVPDGSPSNYIPIDPDDVCKGLRMYPSGPTHKDALMASTTTRTATQTRPTEDDLAALFFLYPFQGRNPEWGTKPLPLDVWTVEKLQATVERYKIPCHGCAFKDDYLQAVGRLRYRQAQSTIERMGVPPELKHVHAKLRRAFQKFGEAKGRLLKQLAWKVVDDVRNDYEDLSSIHMDKHFQNPFWATLNHASEHLQVLMDSGFFSNASAGYFAEVPDVGLPDDVNDAICIMNDFAKAHDHLQREQVPELVTHADPEESAGLEELVALDQDSQERSFYSKMRVKQLQEILSVKGWECRGCAEKSDYVDKVVEMQTAEGGRKEK